MPSVACPAPTLLRDRRDRLPVLLTLLPALWLLSWPSWPTVALALWWTGNTVAHQRVHRRFFRSRLLETLFSVWLSLLLGVPQRLWRKLHLAHHAGRRWRWRGEPGLWAEVSVLLAAALALATQAPVFLCTQYLPGWALGLGLAALHGHYEHAPAVTDCRARWWNLLFLNDGLHAEHHARPGAHYTELPRHLCADARTSRWPPVLRWLEQLSPPALLDLLERAVLRSRWLQRRVLAVHRRALAAVLAPLPAPARVAIVGGGLFPRSAILLRELLPRAEITVLEANPGHVELARGLMPARIRIECAEFRPGQRLPADLLVLPLALRGCRAACVRAPGAPVVLLHDWLWRRRGEGRIVAWWLLKRLVLVRAGPAAARARATGLPAAATA